MVSQVGFQGTGVVFDFSGQDLVPQVRIGSPVDDNPSHELRSYTFMTNDYAAIVGDEPTNQTTGNNSTGGTKPTPEQSVSTPFVVKDKLIAGMGFGNVPIIQLGYEGNIGSKFILNVNGGYDQTGGKSIIKVPDSDGMPQDVEINTTNNAIHLNGTITTNLSNWSIFDAGISFITNSDKKQGSYSALNIGFTTAQSLGKDFFLQERIGASFSFEPLALSGKLTLSNDNIIGNLGFFGSINVGSNINGNITGNINGGLSWGTTVGFTWAFGGSTKEPAK